MGEFFVIAKFQGKGIAQQVARQIWEKSRGKWEITVIPENKKALSFWRKAVSNFTNGRYIEEIKDFDKSQSNRYIFSFDSKA